jgi:hypothetical protein
MNPQSKMSRLAIGWAAMAVTCLIATPVWTAEPQEPVKSDPASIEQKVSINIEEKWGVQIVGVRLTAAGHMLDFRYKVIDPKKAAPILNRKNQPHLIDQATNKMVDVKNMPKIGRLRQNTKTPVEGRIYFMLFPNPGFIKAQSKVTIVVGDFRAENITVEG